MQHNLSPARHFLRRVPVQQRPAPEARESRRDVAIAGAWAHLRAWMRIDRITHVRHAAP